MALFVGVVIAISQTAAMLNLPLYFRFVLGYGPVFAVVALAPLFGALVIAGPVAGFLLERVAPRWLVGGGVIFVGDRQPGPGPPDHASPPPTSGSSCHAS